MNWSDARTRRIAAVCLLVGAVSILYILHHTAYPYPPYLRSITEYFLRTQDVAGSALLMALVLAALFLPTRPAALRFVEACGRHPWRVAAATFVLLCLGALFIQRSHPLPQDEYAALFQSQVFAAGRLTGQFPPELLARLVPPHYLNQFLYGSLQTGEVASSYWPGFAILLTPFTWLQVPWACNPLLASLALVLMARLAERLSGAPQAAGWAMALALGSPAFTAMAITYFSMTAHLLLNLLFAWLLLEPARARLVLAGAVGSLALVLHNPVPHALFALPWIVWLARQTSPHRKLTALAAGYAPLTLLVGVGWSIVLSMLRGEAFSGLYPADGSMFHAVANFLWNWHVKLLSVLALPGSEVLSWRLAELVRLWNWAVPGLLVFAAGGWWLSRGDFRPWLLGLSFITTVAGYLLVTYPQGHGWGARYLHSAWGVLPVLAALLLVRLSDIRWGPAKTYIAILAVLSLLFANGLRAAQIRGYIDAHLAKRPPLVPGARQVVFVRAGPRDYNADLVQNDPFLRGEVTIMLSYGRERDAQLMHGRFPGARLVHDDERGQVWLIEPANLPSRAG